MRVFVCADRPLTHEPHVDFCWQKRASGSFHSFGYQGCRYEFAENGGPVGSPAEASRVTNDMPSCIADA